MEERHSGEYWMITSLIVAMDENGGIGKQNRLPWRQSADLKRFKALTMGHHLIMGRKTYDSIDRSLPGRTTIVVTRKPGFEVQDGFVVHTLEDAFNLARERGEDEVFVIGGADIFSQAISMADRIYLTRVHTSGEADVFFPPFNPLEWTSVESARVGADQNNQHPYTFITLNRKPPGADDRR